jgi:hypothetical protein
MKLHFLKIIELNIFLCLWSLGDRNTANFDEHAELENIDRSAEQQLQTDKQQQR